MRALKQNFKSVASKAFVLSLSLWSMSFLALGLIPIDSALAESKKMRKRTVIDFEESLVTGKHKKPSVAYLMNGKELDKRHLYKTRKDMKGKVSESFWYLDMID